MACENRFSFGLSRLFTVHGVSKAIRNRCWHRLNLCFYICNDKDIMALPRHQFLRRDCFDDLQYYEQYEREQMAPDDYRRESMKRQKLGYHLYTLIEDDRLL